MLTLTAHRTKPRIERNAVKLLENIKACTHDTTGALFSKTPELCNYVWRDYGGIRHYDRSPLSMAVCYNDTWLVDFLVTKTDCDMSFAEVHGPSPHLVHLVLTCTNAAGLVGTEVLL